MTTHGDLLSFIRKRLNDLVASHTSALVAAPATSHDRIAGKIEALSAFNKDLAQISRDFQAYDDEEAKDGTPTLGAKTQASSRARR